jgi:hypothetical protein
LKEHKQQGHTVMSAQFYNLQWLQAMEELNRQIEVENPPLPVVRSSRVVSATPTRLQLHHPSSKKLTTQSIIHSPQQRQDDNGHLLPRPEEHITWDDAWQHFAVLYVRYVQIMRKLEDCYDQIVHPQKRRDIKVALETVMARLVQVKAEVVRFGPDGAQLEYVNFDELLVEQRLAPRDLEVPRPRYFREKQAPTSKDDDGTGGDAGGKQSSMNGSGEDMASLLENLLKEHGLSADDDNDPATMLPKMTREQAIRIIQKNERGRQGQVRCKLMRDLRDEELTRRRLAANGDREQDPNYAATLIQKLFRGYLSRRLTQQQADEELAFIGMRLPPRRDASGKLKYDPKKKEGQIRANRKTRQADMELKYVEALVDIKRDVVETEAPEMRERMWNERYEWWLQHREKTGKFADSFDKYYKEMEALKLEAAEDADPAAKAAREAAAAAKNNPQRGKGGARDKKKEADEAEKMANTTLIGPSNLVSHMVECVEKFRDVWARIDESDNHAQAHDVEITKGKLRPIVAEQVRQDVDAQLLDYLKNVATQVATRALGGKKKKKKKGGGARKKGRRKGRGATRKKKRRRCCDGERSCADMRLADMVSILVKMGRLTRITHVVSRSGFDCS